MHQSPALNAMNITDAFLSGTGVPGWEREGVEGGGQSKCDASGFGLMGAEGAMGFGPGKK